jgi:TonB family protein
MPADVSDSFRLATALPDTGRLEPPLPLVFSREDAAESPRPIAFFPAENCEHKRNERQLPFGLAGSLALHLLPLLALVSWASAPPDIPETIPIQLVMEPPPAPAPQQAPPPRGRMASDDMGPTVDKTAKPATPVPERAPELKTALSAAESPPEPLPRPDMTLDPTPPPQPKPSPKVALNRPDNAVRIMGPSGWRVLGTEPATRDEYLALLKALTQRHMNLLPPSVIAGRRGDTYLSVLVLSDGRIARIAISRSSGYPDIDERVGQMVAAVGRFPPLPARFGDSSLELTMHLRFPEGTTER